MSGSEQQPEAKKTERLCISTHQLLHLEDKFRKKYQGDGRYGAACEIVKALEKHDIIASITQGGLDFMMTQENLPIVVKILAEFAIDIRNLGSRTFHEDLVLSGSLETLASKDPLGHGARILGVITRGKN